MRLLANENFPGEAVTALRVRGHDVAWVRTDSPGASDAEIVGRARAEFRLIVTFDKDSGELAFRAGLVSPSGVILFRIEPRDPAYVARTAVTVIESRDDWAGQFAVVEPGRVRLVPLPTHRARA